MGVWGPQAPLLYIITTGILELDAQAIFHGRQHDILQTSLLTSPTRTAIPCVCNSALSYSSGIECKRYVEQ